MSCVCILRSSRGVRRTIARAFGGHSDALMKEQVKRNIFDVHRQTQGHSQLVTGGGTTAVKVILVSIFSLIPQSP